MSSSSFNIHSLPPVAVLQCVFKALDMGEVPPLPTTALHGAVGWALWKRVCASQGMESCNGCPVEQRCAYPRLFEPVRPEGRAVLPGAVREVPRPLVVAPGSPFLPTGEKFVKLRAGDTVIFRVSLIGQAAADGRTIADLMAAAGQQGLGSHDGTRCRLRLEEAIDVACPDDEAEAKTLPHSCRLDFVTPLRLKAGGRIVSRLEARPFVSALARRAEALAAMYGERWESPLDEKEISRDLDLDADMHVVSVPRYSARQGRRMVWPGLVGAVTLAGPTLPALWPLLRFCERVQVGKNTTFGFGRYLIRAGSE
jgi:hypothetical protein